MQITISNRIQAFSALGVALEQIVAALECGRAERVHSQAARQLYHEIVESPNHNPWFTTASVKMAIEGLGEMLKGDKPEKWMGGYLALLPETMAVQKTVAVIMAGNIPLVGFHDFMCVLLSGHKFLGKLSSADRKLPIHLANLLIEIEPCFKESIEFSEGLLGRFDAVIATGSNNSARYFEYYFGKYPHIIRKNRNSLALISGNESPEVLQKLGSDVFSYFGLGCRNVSKLLIPKDYDFAALKNAWHPFKVLADQHKFYNNYDYFKAVYQINRIPIHDFDFCLLREESANSSPVSVVHYQEYPHADWVADYLMRESEKLQCVASDTQWPGIKTIAFGQCQKPELWDYADQVDTMLFLAGLSSQID